MAGAGWEPWRPGERPGTPGLARIIGHRGAKARAPENTLAGLRKAHELGATWVEFDVMLTADGVPILIHDETLQRTTTGRGSVAANSLKAIRELDAGIRFGAAFAGERVPTLEEAVDLVLALGLGANVEIKPSPGHEQATGEAVGQALLRRWPPERPRLLLSSFKRPALEAVQATAPTIPRGLLAGRLPSDWREAMQGLGCTTLHLDHARVTPASLAALAHEGVPVLLYTVNQVARARELLAAGATALFTDAPDTLIAALDVQ